MRYTAAWGTVVATLVGGCLIKPYTNHVDSSESSSVEQGPSREIPVGRKFEVAAVPDTDLSFLVTSRKQCRSATSSGSVTKRFTYRSRRKRQNLPFVWVFTGIGAGTAGALTTLGDSSDVGVPLILGGAYLLGVGFHQIIKRSYGSSKSTEEIVRQDEPKWEWLDDVYDIILDCPGIEAVPAEGRAARISVSFAGTTGNYYWDMVSDANGLIQLAGARARAQQVAALCGDATFTVTDTTVDPLAVVEQMDGLSTIAREGSYNRLEGTPEEPYEATWRFRSTALAAPAAGSPSFDGLAGGELSTAQACYQNRVDSCVARNDQWAHGDIWAKGYEGAEERCARAQGTMDCLLTYRREYAKSTTSQSQAAAATMRRECQLRKGGDPDVEVACFDQWKVDAAAKAHADAVAVCQ